MPVTAEVNNDFDCPIFMNVNKLCLNQVNSI